MIVKEISFGKEGRDKLIKGVDAVANAVGSTLGARGRTVLIESEQHIGGITVTKDGVTVAKSVNLMDPAENLAVMIMREASEKTANSAGDGTTTSMVLAQSIIHEAMAQIEPSDNLTQVLRDIQEASVEVLAKLDEMSVEITDEKLESVATISANGDTDTGGIIADAYSKVGLTGVVTVEPSKDALTYSEIISGMKIDRGFASKYFVTDHKKQECVLEDPYILVTDQPISHINDIYPILEFILEGNRSLLIVGEIEENALNTLNANKIKAKLKVCSIIPPQFGYKKHQLMQDIAHATGAKYFSEQTGDNLALVSVDDLGRAKKVISGRFNTLLRDPGQQGDVEARVEELQEQLKVEESAIEKDFLKERIANLGGGVAVIYVGAQSDIEQKEKKDRVDDAVCAVRAALEEGILPGGGVALKDISRSIDSINKGYSILKKSLMSPMAKILTNAGMSDEEARKHLMLNDRAGVNVVSMAIADMMDMGIIDPTKVTKEAVRNAVSVATTLLSTDTVITNIRA
jgi:chaperonin GroEL